MDHAERRPSRPASTLRRVSSLAIAATLLLVAVAVVSVTRPAGAATTSLIKFPFASGSTWSVLQGYNTSPVDGGSHYNCDPNTLTDMPSHTESCGAQYQYKYALDLVRADGNTAGQPIYSPVNGTIRWIDDSTGGMSIYMGSISGTDYAFAFFHVNLSAGLAAGQTVGQGQLLGTVALAGQKATAARLTSTSRSGKPPTRAIGAGSRFPSPARSRSTATISPTRARVRKINTSASQ